VRRVEEPPLSAEGMRLWTSKAADTIAEADSRKNMSIKVNIKSSLDENDRLQCTVRHEATFAEGTTLPAGTTLPSGSTFAGATFHKEETITFGCMDPAKAEESHKRPRKDDAGRIRHLGFIVTDKEEEVEAAVRAVGFAVREFGAGANKRRLVSRGVFTLSARGLVASVDSPWSTGDPSQRCEVEGKTLGDLGLRLPSALEALAAVSAARREVSKDKADQE